jgi:hypothetical protein
MLSRICNRPLSSRALGAGGSPTRLLVVALLAALGLFGSDALAAQSTVGLGTADSFAVLAGSTVTNTGPSTINGDLGVSPGTAVTGFPPGTVHGTIHAADAVAGQAQTDLTTAYNDAAGRTPAATVSGDLGGQTLTAGVYKSASSLGLTGALTLDAQGNPNAVFIFQAGSTLTTASGSHVNLINGAQPCNVFWQIGSSATLGTSSFLSGNILALTSISIDNGVTVQGRALARNGAVTLINDTITAAQCATGGGGGAGHMGTGVLTTVPRSVAKTVGRFGTGRCVGGTFRAVVTGRLIRRVVFSLGGRTIATVSKSPFGVSVKTGAGVHTLRAAVTFTDATPAKTLTLRFRSCAPATAPVVVPSAPPVGPPGFTG